MVLNQKSSSMSFLRISSFNDFICCRLSEQQKLEKAKQALEEMIVADEEIQQDEVEQSLKRTEKMLLVSHH